MAKKNDPFPQHTLLTSPIYLHYTFDLVTICEFQLPATLPKKLDSWPKSKGEWPLIPRLNFSCISYRVFIPFKYYPRIRPHRPIVPSLCFSSSVKRTPEEWHQAIAQLKTPSNADLGPIFGHVSADTMHVMRCAEPFSLAPDPFIPYLWPSGLYPLPCSIEWSWGCIVRLFKTCGSPFTQKKVSQQKIIHQHAFDPSDSMSIPMS